MLTTTTPKQVQGTDGASLPKVGGFPGWCTQSGVALVLLILIFILGIYVRTDELRFWNKFPDVFFYDGEPVLANGDGYYYLRMARDLADHQYTEVDYLKKYPDNELRKYPPPLISILVARISRLLPFSIEWTAVLFPVVIGPLLIVPLWRFCRLFGGSRAMGLTAALFAVLSIQYVNRTRIGFFDTDCLNVTFVLITTTFFMMFAFESRRRRYLSFVGGLFFTGLFVMHWDIIRPIVVVISLFPLVIALLFYYRPSLKEGLVFYLCCLMLVALIVLWDKSNGIQAQIRQFFDFIHMLLTNKTGFFSGNLDEVREMKVPTLKQIVDYSAGNGIALFLSAMGLLWGVIRNGKKSLFLVMPVGLAGLTFFLGNRFLIFFAPVAAVGMGYIVDSLWRHPRSTKLIKVIAVCLVLVLAWPAFIIDTQKRYSPALMNLWPGVKRITELTPADSAIWTTWDAGNPLMYYTRRRTISDAQFAEGGERHFYCYLPIASNSIRFSANFIQFFVKNGVQGIHTVYRACGNDPASGLELIRMVLAAGPIRGRKVLDDALAGGRLFSQDGFTTVDSWLRFFFPRAPVPVFLLLHEDMTLGCGWFYFGTWNLASGKGLEPTYHPLLVLDKQAGKLITTGGVLQLEAPDRGLFYLKQGSGFNRLKLSHLLVTTGEDSKVIFFGNNTELSTEIYQPSRFGAIMDDKIAESTFNKLFIRHHQDSSYFTLVAEDIPYYQIWQVQGDSMDIQKLP